MLVPRVIKSEKCKICADYLSRLSKQGYALLKEDSEKDQMSKHDFFFFLYDADRDSNQAQLDKWRVVNMPVVQIVDTNNDGVKYQFPPGPLNVRSIRGKIRELERKT